MIFVKHVLFLVFLTASKYFLVPPLTAIKTSYSPASCNVTNYDFTFIYDEGEKAFKVHGLWPEQCAECLTCGYPSCCATGNMSYIFPSDPEQVAFLNARWFNATTQEECLKERKSDIKERKSDIKERKSDIKERIRDNKNLVPLFEHEFFKHASCTTFRQNASDFVRQVMRLYDEYYAMHVEKRCAGYKQLWLNLDGNFEYNNVTKCI